MATFSLCPHVTHTNPASSLVSLIIRAWIPSQWPHLHDLLQFNYLPKTPSPNTMTSGLGLQHKNFREHKHSVHNSREWEHTHWHYKSDHSIGRHIHAIFQREQLYKTYKLSQNIFTKYLSSCTCFWSILRSITWQFLEAGSLKLDLIEWERKSFCSK